MKAPNSETEAATDAVALDQFPRNRCGLISGVLGDEEDVTRLQSMGVCRGRRVMVVQHGDPLIIRVLGSRIGVSARLAARVLVRPDEENAPRKSALLDLGGVGSGAGGR